MIEVLSTMALWRQKVGKGDRLDRAGHPLFYRHLLASAAQHLRVTSFQRGGKKVGIMMATCNGILGDINERTSIS